MQTAKKIRITEAKSEYVTRGKIYDVVKWGSDDFFPSLPLIEGDDGGRFFVSDSEFEIVDVISVSDKVERPPDGDDRPVAYISGRMSGIEDHNRTRFYAVEAIVEGLGYRVINPARLDDDEGRDDMTWHDFMRRDGKVIFEEADLMVVFDDWENSRGATDEVYMAFMGGVPVKRLVELASADEASQYPDGVLSDDHRYVLVDDVDLPVPLEAKQVVMGPRRADYGHPAENFVRTAALLNAMLAPKLKDGERIDVRDVAMIMIQVKVAREYNAPKRDNMVDICGYAYAYRESLDELDRRGVDLRDFTSDEINLLMDQGGSVANLKKEDSYRKSYIKP